MEESYQVFIVFYIYFYWFCIVVGVLGVVVNIFIIYVIIKTKELHTTLNYYLLSLAFADCFNAVTELFVASLKIFSVPLDVNRVITEINSCNNFVVSNLTLSAMTVDRYIAVCHPLKARYLSKVSRTIKVVVAVWVFSLFYCSSNVIKEVFWHCSGGPVCFVLNIWGSLELYVIVLCFTPGILIITLYTLIGLKIRKFGGVSKDTNMRNTSSTRESTARSGLMLSVAVVVEFLICSVPYQVVLFMTINNEAGFMRSKFLLSLLVFTRMLNVVAVIVDPVIFNYFSSKFRKAFTDMTARKPTYVAAANVELAPVRPGNQPVGNE